MWDECKRMDNMQSRDHIDHDKEPQAPCMDDWWLTEGLPACEGPWWLREGGKAVYSAPPFKLSP